MNILDLDIKGFGKFHNKKISFQKNLNVVYGFNEAGKSTVFVFIKAMLYGLERAKGRASKTDTWTKFKPWGIQNVYGGSLRFDREGKTYLITRDFTKNAPTSFTLFNETDRVPVEHPQKFLKECLCNLTETAYTNTVSIPQLKSSTDAKMVVELRNYIANMNTSGDMSLNISKASDYLKAKKKSFQSQLNPEAAKTYNQNLTEIKQLENTIQSPEYSTHLQTLQNANAITDKRIAELNVQKELLIEKIASKRQHLADLGFLDKPSILSLQEELNLNYNDYLNAKENEKKPLGNGIALFLLILSVLCVLTAIYTYRSGSHNALSTATGMGFQPAVVILALAGLGLLAVASLLFTNRNREDKTVTALKVNLLSTLAKIGAYDSISKENILKANQLLNNKLSIYNELEADLAKSDSLTSDLEELRFKRARYSDGINEKKHNEWELEKSLEKLSKLKEINASLKKEIAENSKANFEIEAIDLALDTLTHLSESIKNSFGLYLNKDASQLIEGLTGGIYDSMSIDENFNVYMNTPGRLIPIEQVSSGTMDQVYLALRIAAGRLLQGRKKELPFIFDDSFVNYDSNRLRAALLWITKNIPEQIIVFSCHKREAQLLTATMQDFHLIEL